MKILLVDDDDFLRDMYATKFEEAGVEVVTASDGAAALELLQEQPVDVLVTDMVMPGMTGEELIAAIKEDEAISCKCVILSNQSEPHDMEKVNQLGIDAYIVKAEALPSDVVEKVLQVMNA
jgi:CheY-like chemotaxis protein